MESEKAEERKVMVPYVNAVQANIGPFDAILRFGLKKDRAKKEMRPEDFQIDLYMSVDFLRAVRDVVDKSLKAYESDISKTKFEITLEKNE